MISVVHGLLGLGVSAQTSITHSSGKYLPKNVSQRQDRMVVTSVLDPFTYVSWRCTRIIGVRGDDSRGPCYQVSATCWAMTLLQYRPRQTVTPMILQQWYCYSENCETDINTKNLTTKGRTSSLLFRTKQHLHLLEGRKKKKKTTLTLGWCALLWMSTVCCLLFIVSPSVVGTPSLEDMIMWVS